MIHHGEHQRRPGGQTLWVCNCADGDAGLAWDWVELQPGVVAMADPLAVVTNLRLVSQDGEALTGLEAVCHINIIVRRLPWQDEVQRALQGLDGSPPPPADRAPARSRMRVH